MYKFEIDKSNFKYIVAFLVLALILIYIHINKPSYSYTSSFLEDKNISINSLRINEIMTSNDGAFADIHGNAYYDWIELYNGSTKDINLTNYGLSDKESGETRWLFPNITIKSQEYLIVYLIGEKKEGLYANFSLKKSGDEYLTLKNSHGKIIDSVKTIKLDENVSYSRNSFGKWFKTTEITPGFSNNTSGREEYVNWLIEEQKELEITEILPNNNCR